MFSREWNLRSYASEIQFLKKWHGVNLKPWNETLVMRHSIKTQKILMMQEIQGVQNRFGGRMEENGREVAQVIGSEAREAPRGQRTHTRSQMMHEHKVFFLVGEREIELAKRTWS